MDCKERIEHALKAQAETVEAYELKLEQGKDEIDKKNKIFAMVQKQNSDLITICSGIPEARIKVEQLLSDLNKELG